MKIIFTTLFVLISVSLFSQEFKYTVTVPASTEEEVIKNMSRSIYAIFDQGADYQSNTSQFIIFSDIDISEEIFLLKMEEQGFKRILFTKKENLSTLNE